MCESSKINDAYEVLASALGIPLDRAKTLNKIYDSPEWDSMGQLSIILALEELTGLEVKDEYTFERLTVVREIAAFISEANREKK